MTFNEEVKDNLSKIIIEDSLEVEAELYACLQSAMCIVMKGRGKIELRLDNDNASICRRLYKHFKSLFSYTPLLTHIESDQFGKNTLYRLVIDDDELCRHILNYFSLVDLSFGFEKMSVIQEQFIQTEEMYSAYLRGVFLMCGYISDPRKMYRIDFSFDNDYYAKEFSSLIEKRSDTQLLSRGKSSKTNLYVKKAEQVSTLIALMGDYKSMLVLENKMAQKEMNNKLQRIINCETSNIDKVINVAQSQIYAINKIINKRGLSSLPEHLIKAAQLRLDNPELSLNAMAEIGEISRSTLNKQLSKIKEIADSL